MERGYLKLWRKSIDSVVFNNPELWKLWCWCLMKSSYKKRWKSVVTGKGQTDVEILPGQFIYGRKTAAKYLKMKESTIRNRMEKLKKIGKIDIKPDTHYSIVTIRNWNTFQSAEDETGQAIGQAKDNQRTTKGHKQEGKEGKEEKTLNEYSPRFEEFWNLYPRKRGKSGAYKHWKKYKCDNGLFGTIMESLNKQMKDPDFAAGGQYVPMGSTWVNGRRWEDEVTVFKKSSSPSGTCDLCIHISKCPGKTIRSQACEKYKGGPAV